MICTLKKEDFLSNDINKQNFIDMLGKSLEEAGHEIQYEPSDADFLIAKAAIDLAQSRSTILVGDDTDFLVLLLYHAEPQSFDLFFRPEVKAHSKKEHKVWNIRKTKQLLGDVICQHILFIHAMLSCDTT